MELKVLQNEIYNINTNNNKTNNTAFFNKKTNNNSSNSNDNHNIDNSSQIPIPNISSTIEISNDNRRRTPDEDIETLSCSQRCKNIFRYHWRGFVIILVPATFMFLLFQEPTKAMRCAFLLVIMAIYWMTEVIPIPVTSLLPIVAFPLMGVMDSDTTCQQYFRNVVAFFVCSMVIAIALEQSNLHKRMAMCVILTVGSSVRRIHFGLTMLTMFVSFWIANAAAATLMCPIAGALLDELAANGFCELYDTKKPPKNPDDRPYPSRVVTCYYLSLAYAGGIGGLGLLMSSNTNVVFAGIYTERFPLSTDMEFTSFSLFNFPLAIIFTLLFTFWMQFLYLGLWRKNSEDAQTLQVDAETQQKFKELIKKARAEAEPWSMNEIIIATLFILLIVLLFTQRPGIFPGWADFFNDKKVGSSVPPTFIFILIFAIPANYYFLKYFICKVPKVRASAEPMLTWNIVKSKLPWGSMLLLGGGMALSVGMQKSELSVVIGNSLQTLIRAPKPIVLLCVMLVSIGFTSFCMNAAIASILTPVVLELSVVIKTHPAYLALGALIGVSLSFLFPMSSGPNAIVYELVNIRNKDMFIAGLGAIVIGFILYFAAIHLWGPVIFKDFYEFPKWAEN